MKTIDVSGLVFALSLMGTWPGSCLALTPPLPPPCPPELAKKTVSELGAVVADSSGDWKRQCAADLLVVEGEKAIPVLIDLLASEDSTTWIHAVNSIERLGPKAAAAVPYLIRQIDGRDPFPKGYGPQYLYQALAAIGEAAMSGIPPLLEKSGTAGDDSWSATMALGKLGRYAPEAVVPYLIELMEKGEPEGAAVESLRMIRKPASAAIPYLTAKLNAAIASGRSTGALIPALVAIEAHDKMIPLLITYLEQPQLARVAAEGLAQIGQPAAAAVPALIRGLNKPHVERDARDAFVDALGNIAPTSLPVLEQFLIEATERDSLRAALVLAETDPLPLGFAPKLRKALETKPLEKDPDSWTLQRALANTHAR